MTVQQTSLEAYEVVYDDLGNRQKEVYDIIKDNPNVCNEDIADLSNRKINCITPRVKELRDFNLIVQSGVKINNGGFQVMIWKVK